MTRRQLLLIKLRRDQSTQETTIQRWRMQRVRSDVVERISNISDEIQCLLLVVEEGLEFWANELIFEKRKGK
jgi:hypothetical protein